MIISGPSGVGKDTIIEALRARPRDPDYHYVVTCTTRAPRPGEVDGVSYHFLDRERFLALRDAGGLLEANEVHGNWYGTPRQEVRDALAEGHDVILKIDVQGAQQVKERVDEALLIFIVPPSMETLFGRLRARATESADELELRQRNAAIELARQEDYDHVVVNETGQVERTARADRRDHRRDAPPPSDATGPRLGAWRDARSRGRRARSRPRGRGWWRWPSTRPARAATGPTPTSCRRRSPTSSPARRSSSSSGGARRSASCSARGPSVPGVTPKPIVDRVRADGPLLPPLGLALARWIAAHYLAPPALVLRAMLPPGMLERLELVAELAPGASDAGTRRAALTPVDLDLLDQLAGGPRPARTLAAPEGRAGLPAAPGAGGRGPDLARVDAARARPPGRATSAGST